MRKSPAISFGLNRSTSPSPNGLSSSDNISSSASKTSKGTSSSSSSSSSAQQGVSISSLKEKITQLKEYQDTKVTQLDPHIKSQLESVRKMLSLLADNDLYENIVEHITQTFSDHTPYPNTVAASLSGCMSSNLKYSPNPSCDAACAGNTSVDGKTCDKHVFIRDDDGLVMKTNHSHEYSDHAIIHCLNNFEQLSEKEINHLLAIGIKYVTITNYHKNGKHEIIVQKTSIETLLNYNSSSCTSSTDSSRDKSPSGSPSGSLSGSPSSSSSTSSEKSYNCKPNTSQSSPDVTHYSSSSESDRKSRCDTSKSKKSSYTNWIVIIAILFIIIVFCLLLYCVVTSKFWIEKSQSAVGVGCTTFANSPHIADPMISGETTTTHHYGPGVGF